MSYPPPKYHGQNGEVTAKLRRPDQEPDLVNASGGSVDYLATGEMTGGEFGLYRWNFGPAVTGPDPHFHRTISETFYILSGTIRLYDGKKWVDGTPGDFLYVAQGGIHGFKNESGEPASMLLLFTPGAPREEYFETLAAIGKGELELTEEERREFFLRHDNHWV
ncbi:MAG TPA: cupin domain-containing protein [Actinopolymorphaceae bacterium]